MRKIIIGLFYFALSTQAFARSPKSMAFTKPDGSTIAVTFDLPFRADAFAGNVDGTCRNPEYTQNDQKEMYVSHPSYNPYFDDSGKLIWNSLTIGTTKFFVSQMTVFSQNSPFGSKNDYVHTLIFDSFDECIYNENPVRELIGLNTKANSTALPEMYVGWERDTDVAYLWDHNGWGGWGSQAPIRLEGKVTQWFP